MRGIDSRTRTVPGTTRHAKGSRLFASLLALAFVGGQVSSYVHLALVRHVQCSEHGELVHTGASEPAAVQAAAEPTSVTLFAQASGADPDHRHEHCAMAPHRRHTQAVRAERQLAVERPLVVGRVFDTARSFFDPSEARYRLAPKTSPPA